jgi:hypothetical protein
MGFELNPPLSIHQFTAMAVATDSHRISPPFERRCRKKASGAVFYSFVDYIIPRTPKKIKPFLCKNKKLLKVR